MKDKKGFTLIELLAVIVILSVILAIAGTAVINSINDSKKKTKFLAASDIVNIAQAYMIKEGVDQVFVNELVDNGYLESDVTNPLTGENINTADDLALQVIIKDDTAQKQEDYELHEDSSIYYYEFEGYKYEFAESLIADAGGSGGDSCLVEGTKIKTKEGYKNIEDIRYDDLLVTWSYDLGEVVYEYPIWIEKESSSDSYQETTFSDGTVLKTVGFHGIYSYDLNKFVSVDDKENFKVGTHVAKIDNGKLKSVTVTKIEYKKEKVNYYHVESTRYYNVIANDLVTTDGYVELTNLYNFNSNITWIGNEEILKDKSNLYSYDDLKQFVPYYLYKGLRMQEAKYLVNKNVITKEMLISILNNTMLNESETLQPIMKNGSRYWMVTLETDKINTKNKGKYLKREGSTYVLPKDDDVKYWYNSSDNKYYKPGSKVKVYHGMYFTKIK